MKFTEFLQRSELVLAGSFLTLAAIWFNGDRHYDWAGFVVMGLFFAVQLGRALTSDAQNPDNG